LLLHEHQRDAILTRPLVAASAGKQHGQSAIAWYLESHNVPLEKDVERPGASRTPSFRSALPRFRSAGLSNPTHRARRARPVLVYVVSRFWTVGLPI
jgi:hypothetical protein